MILRIYKSQLDKLAAEKRERLEACGERHEKWVDVPGDCFDAVMSDKPAAPTASPRSQTPAPTTPCNKCGGASKVAQRAALLPVRRRCITCGGKAK